MKKSIKKTMSIAVALALTAGIAVPAVGFNTEVSAMEYQSDEYSPYSKRAEWVKDVKWSFNQKNGTLTISGNGIIGYRNSLATFPWESIASKVKRVIVNKGITEIGYGSFDNFTSMESISLPEGLVRIDQNAFLSCDKLKSIHFPASLTTLDENINALSSLEKITVDKNNKYFKSIDNVLFSYDMKKLLDYPMTKKNEVYYIPEGVQQIGKDRYSAGGFGYNNYLKKIVMPKSMQIIREAAFFRCRNLANVVLNEGLKTIGSCAFEGNYALKSIVIPSTVKRINSDVFVFCKNLKTVKILSKNCAISESRNTLPLNANIYGYAGSTTEKFITKMGGIFVDIMTNKKYNYSSSNTKLVSQLPVTLTAAEPHSANISQGYTSDGKANGYQTNVYHETNKNSKNYKTLLSKVNSIVKNCKTDYNKAVELTKWVNRNISYRYATFPGNSIASVYAVYNNKCGNCMGKSLLLEYMLYLAGIPNAHLTSADHSWSAALISGKWLILDPTNYQVSYNADKFDKITKITFTSGSNTFDVHDNCGVYLSGITYKYSDTDKLPTCSIPSFVKNIYPNVQRVLNTMVTLNTEKMTLKKGRFTTLTVSGRTKELKWSTSDSPGQQLMKIWILPLRLLRKIYMIA